MKRIAVLIVLFLSLVAVMPLFADDVTKQSIESFDGKPIGVQTAVLYEELIADRVPNTTFQYYTMPNDMILALQSKKISAYLIEQVGFGVQKANHPELETLDEKIPPQHGTFGKKIRR